MKFNTKKEVKTVVNRAGGRAFRMDAKQELIHAVLTTFLDDKYYESGKDRIARIQKLIGECQPRFVANLAVIARKEFNLRSVSHLLLGELSKVHFGDSLIKDAIVEATLRPDDCLEIAAYVGKPMTKQVKRGIRNSILKYDRYQLAKYRGEGKGMSMVDIFNLVHPKVQHANREQKEAWKDLMEGTLTSFDTWEVESSAAKNDAEREKIWEKLVMEDKLGYMALIRNMNNFEKYNISHKAQARVVARLTDPEEVKRSKQLPFRFYTAYKNVQGNRAYTTAISDAMDIALENTPRLKGKTLIAVDSSGSMSGDPTEKASIFAATLAQSNPDADVILYDTNVQLLSINGRAPVIDVAEKLMGAAMGGGTQTSLVFQFAFEKKKNYDRFVILSDNESWNEHSVQSAYNNYKKLTGTDPFVYAIDIQGYGTKDLSGNKIFHLTGWSDRLLDFIGQTEKGESLIEYVENYEIPSIINVVPKPKKVAPKKKKRIIKKRSVK